VNAVFSECGLYRWRLDFDIAATGKVALLCGVNPSKAGKKLPDGSVQTDQTVTKWKGFGSRNDWCRGIAVNPFGFIATDVRGLSWVDDPFGRDNEKHIDAAIAEADELVPCWGNRSKVPKPLRFHFERMLDRFKASGKPIKIFGLTKSGDPMHPLMLGYSTPLTEWVPW
jgi:hypothetical protein